LRIVRVNQRGNITSESQILKRRKCARIVAVCKSVDVRRRLEKGEGKEKVRMIFFIGKGTDDERYKRSCGFDEDQRWTAAKFYLQKAREIPWNKRNIKYPTVPHKFHAYFNFVHSCTRRAPCPFDDPTPTDFRLRNEYMTIKNVEVDPAQIKISTALIYYYYSSVRWSET